MPPFQMPPNANGPQSIHRQPIQNVGSSMKDPFSTGLDPGGIGNLLPQIPVGGSSNTPSQYVTITSSDFNKFGIPGHHYSEQTVDDISLGMGGAGGHSIILPPSHGPNPPSGIGGEVVGGGREGMQIRSTMDNFFGMSLTQLGGLSVSQVEGPSKEGIMGGRAVGSRPVSKGTIGVEKFPSSGVGLEGFSLNSMDSSSLHLSSGSSILNSSSTMVTPSTSYYVMAPDSSKRDSPFVSTAMVPIGAERAQKSAVLPPAAFPGEQRIS